MTHLSVRIRGLCIYAWLTEITASPKNAVRLKLIQSMGEFHCGFDGAYAENISGDDGGSTHRTMRNFRLNSLRVGFGSRPQEQLLTGVELS